MVSRLSMLLTLGVVVLAGTLYWARRVLREPQAAPSLATLRRTDVAWDGDRLIVGGVDYSRGAGKTRYVVLGERDTVLGAPEGLSKAHFVELATTASRHPVLLWIELTGRDMRLRTATYMRDTGWTATRELFHGRSVVFTGERPVADPATPDRYRLARVAALDGAPSLLQLHMTDSGWAVESTVKRPEAVWVISSAVGVTDASGSQWYAMGGRLDANNEPALVVVEPTGVETIAWSGSSKQSVSMLAAVETAGTRRIFAAVLRNGASTQGATHALLVLRQRDPDEAWILENTEVFSGQIQHIQILAASADRYTLGVEHADFSKQELDVWEISGPTPPPLARRRLAPTNALNEVRWLRDRDSALQIIAVHLSPTGGPWISRRVPAP